MPPSAIMGRLSKSQEKSGGKTKKSKTLSLEYKESRISERVLHHKGGMSFCGRTTYKYKLF